MKEGYVNTIANFISEFEIIVLIRNKSLQLIVVRYLPMVEKNVISAITIYNFCDELLAQPIWIIFLLFKSSQKQQ